MKKKIFAHHFNSTVKCQSKSTLPYSQLYTYIANLFRFSNRPTNHPFFFHCMMMAAGFHIAPRPAKSILPNCRKSGHFGTPIFGLIFLTHNPSQSDSVSSLYSLHSPNHCALLWVILKQKGAILGTSFIIQYASSIQIVTRNCQFFCNFLVQNSLLQHQINVVTSYTRDCLSLKYGSV